jgi:uncharacterized delta-60 repeat protein
MACTTMLLASVAHAAAGDLDPAFGTGGRVLTSLGSGQDSAQAMAIQPDGKIVVAGFAELPARTAVLLRYNADGSPDDGFGSTGVAAVPIRDGATQFFGLALQPDGKVVAVGLVDTIDPIGSSWLLVRLDERGVPDPEFGSGGIVIADAAGQFGHANAVVLDPLGNLVVAGTSAPGTSFATTVARFQPNGTPDETFGTSGASTFEASPGPDIATDVALDASGGILVLATAGEAGASQIALLRYLSGGTLDAGFGSGGVVTSRVGPISDIANAVLVQPDGKIVVASTARRGFYQLCSPSFPGCIEFPNDAVALLRFAADGEPDSSFGAGGVVVNDISFGFDSAESVVQQDDGKLVVAGLIQTDFTQAAFFVGRYEEDGTRDATFGANGFATTRFAPNEFSGATAVRLQPGLGITAAGNAGDIGMATTDIALARYQIDCDGLPCPTPTDTPRPTETVTATIGSTATVTTTPTASLTASTTPTATALGGHRVSVCVNETDQGDSCTAERVTITLQPLGVSTTNGGHTFDGVPPGDYTASATPRCGAFVCWYDTAVHVADSDVIVRLMTASTCAGNCDGNCDVTVDELVAGVRLSLTSGDVAECRAFDRDFDGQITIDELVLGVRGALEGCSVETRPPGCPG